MRYKKITIEVEEDNGETSYRVLDLDNDGNGNYYTILRAELSTDFSVKNASEIVNLVVERITPKSIEFANHINNPFWK